MSRANGTASVGTAIPAATAVAVLQLFTALLFMWPHVQLLLLLLLQRSAALSVAPAW
jgi:hypothetical protein